MLRVTKEASPQVTDCSSTRDGKPVSSWTQRTARSPVGRTIFSRMAVPLSRLSRPGASQSHPGHRWPWGSWPHHLTQPLSHRDVRHRANSSGHHPRVSNHLRQGWTLPVFRCVSGHRRRATPRPPKAPSRVLRPIRPATPRASPPSRLAGRAPPIRPHRAGMELRHSLQRRPESQRIRVTW
jgi:hypothetical protein